MGYLLVLILIVSTTAELGTVSTPEQKKMMDTPTYGEPIYAPGVKTNLILGRQWQQILFEDFESGSIPVGWTVLDGNSDGYMWQIYATSAWHTNAMPGDSGQYIAAYDDDAIGSNPATEEELIPPAFSSTIYDSVSFIYSFGYQNYAGYDTFAVRVRTHDGASWGLWSNLVLYHIDMGSGLWDTLDLSSYLPADSMQVEFNWWDHHASHYDWYVAVDNVELLGHLGGGGMFDIGVTALNSPPSLMKLDSIYQVISTMRNFGDSAMTFGVHTEITDLTGTTFYFQYDSSNIYLLPDSTIAVNFGNWTMTAPDDYIYQTYVTTPDSFSANDTMQTTLLAHIDFAADSIISPPLSCTKDVPYDVIARFANAGQNDTTVDLHSEISLNGSPIFSKDSLGVSIPAGTDITVNFGSVTFTDYGNFSHIVYTSSPFDIDPANDTLAVAGVVAAWQIVTNMPLPLMDHAVVFDGSNIYVLGGYSGSGQDSVFIYSASKGTWSTGANMPIDLCMYDACVLGDTIYVPGGNSYGAGSIIDSLYKYSISGNNWTTFPGTGEPAWFYACAAANGKVYKIGGLDNVTSTLWASTWEYTPGAGWIKKTDMSTAVELAERWVKNDTIYIVGGHDGVATPTNVTQFYDAVNDIWTQDNTQFAYYPNTLWGAGSAVYKDTVYVMAGIYGGSITDSVFCYDYVSNTWFPYHSLVQGVYRTDGIGVEGVGAGFDGVYLFGGSTGGFTPISDVQATKILLSGVDEYTEERAESYLSIPSSIGMGELMFTFYGDKPTTLFVRDILGRVVKEYKNVRPGTALSFGGNDVSSGIYFISIKEGKKTAKITLIK